MKMAGGRVALLMGVVVQGGEAAPVEEFAVVCSQVFDVAYEVDDEALPLTDVALWYRRTADEAWRRYGSDPDRHSPVSFTAPQEGAYEFFLLLENTTGPSSQPPTPKTAPHLRLFVDYTPPVVQVHSARVEQESGRRVLIVRWSALDAHLLPRGIELTYRVEGDEAWRPVCPERLSNSGRYDWRLPEELTGLVRLRVRVYDRGGHVAESIGEPVDVTASPPATREDDQKKADALGGAVSVERQKEAARLLAAAREARARHSARLALARITEAVRLDSTNVEALAELGGVLYDLQEWDRSAEAFELALGLKGDHRAARVGLARVLVQRNELERAGEHLQAILKRAPNDAQTWMDLGDVLLKRGDDVGARECYHQASTVDPTAVDVVTAVRKRIENLDLLSRRFRRAGSDPP